MISVDKKEALERRLASLGIYEDDLIEKFIRGTGSGGQKNQQNFFLRLSPALPF
jgi:hypothetical protein